MTLDAKKILKIGSLIVLSLFIIIYAFFRSKDLIFGVKIKGVNLVDGAKMTERVIEVAGNARNATLLSLNDRPISIDEKGNFKETIILNLGYNIVSLKAKDEFGKSDEKNYQLMH